MFSVFFFSNRFPYKHKSYKKEIEVEKEISIKTIQMTQLKTIQLSFLFLLSTYFFSAINFLVATNLRTFPHIQEIFVTPAFNL